MSAQAVSGGTPQADNTADVFDRRKPQWQGEDRRETTPTTVLFFTTKIGQHRYMNTVNFEDDVVPGKWSSAAVEDFTVLPYRIVRGELELCRDESDNGLLGNAVNAGAKGKLKEFLAENGDEIFDAEPGSTFRRLSKQKGQ